MLAAKAAPPLPWHHGVKSCRSTGGLGFSQHVLGDWSLQKDPIVNGLFCWYSNVLLKSNSIVFNNALLLRGCQNKCLHASPLPYEMLSILIGCDLNVCICSRKPHHHIIFYFMYFPNQISVHELKNLFHKFVLKLCHKIHLLNRACVVSHC